MLGVLFTYKERSRVNHGKIKERSLVVVIERDLLFISNGYCSDLNNQLLLIKKRADCKKGMVHLGLLTTSTQPGTV